MKNFICLNGQKIKMNDVQVTEMRKLLGIDKLNLKDIPIGETFKIKDYEFIVLEHSKETTAVIMKNLLYNEKQFGKNNNFENSNVDEICKQFGCEIAAVIGKDNLVEHTVDLTSDDGLKDYGKIRRKMSLLTANLYRRYVEILDKHKIKAWWWLSTAYSTPAHEDDRWVKSVSPVGNLINDYYYDSHGVRPFCILNSNIFVSR